VVTSSGDTHKQIEAVFSTNEKYKSNLLLLLVGNKNDKQNGSCDTLLKKICSSITVVKAAKKNQLNKA
jgi:hypothetical protein